MTDEKRGNRRQRRILASKVKRSVRQNLRNLHRELRQLRHEDGVAPWRTDKDEYEHPLDPVGEAFKQAYPESAEELALRELSPEARMFVEYLRQDQEEFMASRNTSVEVNNDGALEGSGTNDDSRDGET